MITFEMLGIDAPILSALADCGYAEPTAIQEKAIPAGIAGRDVLGSAQTGTGKTCAFGVPILQRLARRKGRGVRALILTPTRELAIQIDENFQAYGKNLPLTETVIFGGVGQAPQVERLKQGTDILTATPGRLLDLCGQGLLDLSRVEIFVLDEADRMLDMGFIHDVRKVIKLLPEKKQTMFFSATLPPEIMDLVNSLLHDPVRAEAAPISSPVEVIRQEVCLVDRKNKTALLAQILEEETVRNALVFTRTKHGADKVARDLNRKNISAAAIHGNKSQTARQDSLKRFKNGQLRVLVATDIAARGLDIEELAYVFNYNLPEVPETYIHRIGRTGRAGHGGTAISFCDFGEMPLLKDIEKLMKRTVPRRDHDFPMEVFEVPVKDARGRIVNPEDAESRKAAQERSAQRKQKKAEKLLAEERQRQAAQGQEAQPKAKKSRKKKAAQTEAAAPTRQETAAPARQSAPAPAPKKEKTRRPMPHGKQQRGDLQAFLDAQPQDEKQVVFAHRNPLEGDRIMDATARLLAAKPSFRFHKPNESRRHASRRKDRSQERKTESGGVLQAAKQPVKQDNPAETRAAPGRRKAPKKGAPVPPAKLGQERGPAAKRERGRNRMPPRVEPPKSRQKDSTEQKSLMKPFYIDHD